MTFAQVMSTYGLVRYSASPSRRSIAAGRFVSMYVEMLAARASTRFSSTCASRLTSPRAGTAVQASVADQTEDCGHCREASWAFNRLLEVSGSAVLSWAARRLEDSSRRPRPKQTFRRLCTTVVCGREIARKQLGRASFEVGRPSTFFRVAGRDAGQSLCQPRCPI